jgi:hypothetical protein
MNQIMSINGLLAFVFEAIIGARALAKKGEQ